MITGSTGFIGKSVLSKLLLLKHTLHAAFRVKSRLTQKHSKVSETVVGEIGPGTDWEDALANVECVIHLAARTHIMKDEVRDPLAEYRRINVDGTLNLARQAVASGVRRFIFVSSIKVNGEETPVNQPFSAEDTPRPEDPYGISKWEAEQGLQKLASETGIEVVIIRPPLVYGAGAKGNLATMVKLVEKGALLPFGAVHNQRSLVALDNLVDLIVTCTDHPAAANQVFLAGDGRDLSTTELLRCVAKAMGKPSRLVPVPAYLLMIVATLLGKRLVAQRLLGSLQVDISKARDLLGWEPPFSVEEGLRRYFQS